MEPTRLKECPQCGLRTALDTSICEQCGRQYRTQFVRGVTIPPGVLQPLPVAPPEPPPALPSQSEQFGAVLAECTAQWHQVTWMRVLSVFLIPAFFVGVILWFYFGGKENDLRYKVASLGVNAAQWEASLRPQRYKTYAIAFGVPTLLIVALFVLMLTLARIGTHGAAGSSDPSVSRSDPAPSIATAYAADHLVLGEDGGQITSELGSPSDMNQGRDPDGGPNGFQTWHYQVQGGGDLYLILRNSQIVRILQTNDAGQTTRLERSAYSPL